MRLVESNWMLICSVGTQRCAVPLGHVSETMRPLPVSPVRGAPSFLLGLAMIRGAAVPVLDAGSLLFGVSCVGEARRLVSLDLKGRTAALAVTSVVGTRRWAPDVAASLPPLLAGEPASRIEVVARLDADLLFVLEAGRLVADSVWDSPEPPRA